MLKLTGTVLVIFSCTAIGYGKSLDYSRRQRQLEEIQKMLHFLLGEIIYRKEALPEAMMRVAEKTRPPLSEFLREISKEAKENQGERFSLIFSQTAVKYLKESSLTKNDLEEFIRLGEDLGYMDISMQENTINLYLETLRGEIARTDKEAPAKKKMYQALGVLAGIFLAVMLI